MVGPPLIQSLVLLSTRYLIVPGFLDRAESDALLQRSKQLLEEFDLQNHPLTKFTTKDDDHVGDDYFLTSGDKIRYFLEADAVDASGALTRPKEKAVNKIGHALHELDPAFHRVTLENPRLRALVRDLGFHKDPVVPEHNDSTFLVSPFFPIPSPLLPLPSPLLPSSLSPSHQAFPLSTQYTNPPSALGFWIALEKCTSSNGALSFAPGSHKTAPLTKRFVRLPQGGTGMQRVLPVEEEQKISEAHKGKYVLETCEPGDLVLIHGSVLHKSERNTSPNTRFAYTFHMIESPPHATYDEKNWLQPTAEMPFSRILV
ncbi:hypothetical protein CCMSSC00406_0003983 [Pleurotus cornucopiae]|uniref:Uncharacterized protein n=1 Tax=Pleurotus cornucopiae TaxID=5321 RepID=A0ACB7IQJ3_PLECO|nr:hypothetical protein CCMSSC00406_0003983 [Pleurotus cornucopiae]